MRKVARKGDRTLGVCRVHGKKGGTIVSASEDSIDNMRGIARIGDLVRADCGHYGTICTASDTDLVNARRVARIGDGTTGTYVASIITGSDDTFSG